ncbi:MAG: transposase [Bacteroidetes bacterium]|nr:transposase [Bacteroidota bacterium]NWJ51943.1 transposase [Bacteroidota bacterium]NWJ53370.1 transposase [Bacteroidota bacterium]
MRTYNRYSDKFKRSLVQKVEDGKIGKKEAELKYGIKGHASINGWIQKYGYLSQRTMKAKTGNTEPVKSLQELEAENHRLRKDLDMEQLRNRALNVMIDIAEKQFKIPIRKKPGAKQ